MAQSGHDTLENKNSQCFSGIKIDVRFLFVEFLYEQ